MDKMDNDEMEKTKATLDEAIRNINSWVEVYKAANEKIVEQSKQPAKITSVYELSHEEILRKIQTYEYTNHERADHNYRTRSKLNEISQKDLDAGFLNFLMITRSRARPESTTE